MWFALWPVRRSHHYATDCAMHVPRHWRARRGIRVAGFRLRNAPGVAVAIVLASAAGLEAAHADAVTARSGAGAGIAAGRRHACALRQSDSCSPICWGNDADGQVSGAPADTALVTVSCGYDFCIGINSTGGLVGWGEDTDGKVSQVPQGVFSAVSCGEAHACALPYVAPVSEGAAQGGAAPVCWGSSFADGRTSPPVSDGGAAASLTAIACGGSHCCGIRASDRRAACWGDDSDGQSTPPLATFDALSSGRAFTCGVQHTTTFALCWGADIGDPPAGVPFAMVSAGYQHACGASLDTNAGDGTRGDMFCWGDRTGGKADPPLGIFYLDAAAGQDFTCGLLANSHTVGCFGSNAAGQVLGAPTGQMCFSELPWASRDGSGGGGDGGGGGASVDGYSVRILSADGPWFARFAGSQLRVNWTAPSLHSEFDLISLYRELATGAAVMEASQTVSSLDWTGVVTFACQELELAGTYYVTMTRREVGVCCVDAGEVAASDEVVVNWAGVGAYTVSAPVVQGGNSDRTVTVQWTSNECHNPNDRISLIRREWNDAFGAPVDTPIRQRTVGRSGVASGEVTFVCGSTGDCDAPGVYFTQYETVSGLSVTGAVVATSSDTRVPCSVEHVYSATTRVCRPPQGAYR